MRSWYQDVHTGAGKDALLLRPGDRSSANFHTPKRSLEAPLLRQ